ncbi:hypothetical protein OIO90_004213 [Microbotryomycetes sp. JL221]|nr:hypothetical protein OIO90_004213 [Microbotryomycetes sp. JL221]
MPVPVVITVHYGASASVSHRETSGPACQILRQADPVPTLTTFSVPLARFASFASTIAGKKILNEYIALGVYGLTGLGAWAATRGGSKAKENAKVEPKLNASSEDEAAFLQNFINNLEHEEKAHAKH